MPASKNELLEQVHAIAKGAGELVMSVYRSDFAARSKDDASPVTEADERAEALILDAASSRSRPRSRSSPRRRSRPVASREVGRAFWLVDPLDGTKEFINRNDEFTVNIALVEDGEPTLGVVLAPALGRLFAGAAGVGAYVEDAAGRRPIRCRAVPEEGLTVVASRSHGDADALERLSRRAQGGGRSAAPARR